MSTIILTYNPDKWDWAAEGQQDAINLTRNGQPADERWSTGGRNSGIAPGDRAFLFQQGLGSRGLIGSGWFTGGCYVDQHWLYEDRDANYADVSWEVLLDPADLLPIALVESQVEGVNWGHMQGSGVLISDTASDELEALWAQHLGVISPKSPPNLDDKDMRNRVLAQVIRRQGQPSFRRDLLKAYGGACAITGCTQIDALQAAHIRPFLGAHSNEITNGILLRADLHTLFDLGLVAVDSDNKVVVSKKVTEPGYQQMDGWKLNLPPLKKHRPSAKLLKEHLETRFQR